MGQAACLHFPRWRSRTSRLCPALPCEPWSRGWLRWRQRTTFCRSCPPLTNTFKCSFICAMRTEMGKLRNWEPLLWYFEFNCSRISFRRTRRKIFIAPSRNLTAIILPVSLLATTRAANPHESARRSRTCLAGSSCHRCFLVRSIFSVEKQDENEFFSKMTQ